LKAIKVIRMSIAPFSSDDDLLKFAKRFFCNRLETFRKDIEICMTPNKRGEHAYFPALLICIAFTELLSGLYAGKLWTNLGDLKRYIAQFIRHPEYTPHHVDLLYECLRHKVAHLAYPYPVFDTTTSKIFKGKPRHLVTWTINVSNRRPAIELVKYTRARTLAKDRTPWRVPYDARIKVRVRRFHLDIIESICGPSGYLKHLESDAAARKNFAAFMKGYYPPSAAIRARAAGLKPTSAA
jgi:hypothetical protein